MKFFSRISDNLLFAISLFLLAFIPLYPKLPLIDVKNTWVYIRAEDFIVGIVVLIWITLLLFKKVTLKTPLTLPIILFWIIGGIATLHGVLIIFPTLSNVFSNVALLSFFRRIEYMFLFFVAFAAIKDKKNIYYVIATLVVVLLLVVAYGFGQKYLGFPAYLTMNEEFAKGIPIRLSALSRVPSTFAGHYDLAAYLVLVIPILVSTMFGFRNLFIKAILAVTSVLGFALLFMTVSRVSFFVLLLSLGLLLVLQRKKILTISLIVITIAFLGFFPSLLQRFGSTVTEVDVLVDAKTGEAIGNARLTTTTSFAQKTIVGKAYETKGAVFGVNRDGIEEDIKASNSAVIPFVQLLPTGYVLISANAPTGENLPQGSGYVNLHLSPVKEKINQFFFEIPNTDGLSASDRVVAFQGNFLIKKAKAYDLSYTTRFQGEWPHTIDAFKRNIFFGNGYGSVSLAVDNNYLRILGESGLFGLGSFLLIFIVAGIYIKKILPQVDSPVVRNYVLGFAAGTFGLALNAILIDVFEASKVAFTYWLLMGLTLGILYQYKKGDIEIYKEFKKLITSAPAVIIFLLIVTAALLSSAYSYYFAADDFTWLRWAAQCREAGGQCNIIETIRSYFTETNGFFYRPGTKIYFFFMYSAFWLNQTMYHLVSLILHFIFVVLVFLLAKKVFKNYFLSVLSAFIFLMLSVHAEAIFWISSTGHLFNAVFALLAVLSYIAWKEKKRIIYFIGSVCAILLSLLFHELGVVVPLLLILYDVVFGEGFSARKILRSKHYLVLSLPVLLYLVMRYSAGSHWFNGDYSYNLLKLPYNFVGNTIGYIMLTVLGPSSASVYNMLRNISKDHVLLVLPLMVVAFLACIAGYKYIASKLETDEKKVLIFGLLFFIISLLPFLGLGNIASRYAYLSSVGLAFVMAFLLEKVYQYLKSSNDYSIALASTTMIAIVFSSIQLVQLQGIQGEWKEVGEKSKRFLISLNEMYSQGWQQNELKFYFVDVPIKYGDAWIFPVGLSDAVWFVYKNENISIDQVSTLDEALQKVQDPSKEKVFLFQSDGSIIEKTPPPKAITVQ